MNLLKNNILEFFTNKFVSIVYLIGVFILILPSFIRKNTNLKIILQNLSIWCGIILVLITIMVFLKIL